MERQDARRVQQGQKHEQYRHPLMVLIARARKMARSMFTTRPEYDLEALNLLGMILGLYRQFSHNPVWRSVQRAAVDEHNFTHDVMMLAFVSQTFSFENGINVRIEEQHRVRFADARIVIGPQSVIGVEVKTHHLLRHSPEKTLTLEDADEVMNECFGSANTKTGGQLRDDHPGFLVIGNLELSPENMQSLMKAALRKFDKSAATRQHIYGVGFVWFEQKTDQNVHPYPVLDSIGFRYPRPVIHTGTINFNYVENPHYTGTVHIKIMPGSRSSLIRV